MPSPNLKSISRRIEKLEAEFFPRPEADFWRGRRGKPRWRPSLELRFGRLRRLPPDYQGERHMVVAKRLPDQGWQKWFEFEEVPGPAPSEPPRRDPRLHVCLEVIFVGSEDPPVA